MKEKTLFSVLCTATVISFLLCGYSLISCFVYESDGGGLASHILEISYLFIHLIICAIIFYLAFRAIKMGSFFIKNLIYEYDGSIKKKNWIIYIVLDSIFFLFFIYSAIESFSMALPLANEIGKIVWNDLMNASFLLFSIFLAFVLYVKVPFVRSNKNAE